MKDTRMLGNIPVTDNNGGRLYVDVDAVLLAVTELFAGLSDLPQHVLDLRRRHEVPGERFSIFDHLFEVAPCETVLTKDYRFGYRLRTLDQCEMAKRTGTDDEMA
jgi:hypothetical protein